jgi:hypothetical protein
VRAAATKGKVEARREEQEENKTKIPQPGGEREGPRRVGYNKYVG